MVRRRIRANNSKEFSIFWVFLIIEIFMAAGTSQASVCSDPLFIQIRDSIEGDLLLQIPIRRGSEFSISYTHSTAKTIIEEYLIVEGPGDLLLTRSIFSSAGNGIPDTLPEGASFSVTPDGKFEVKNLNRRFNDLKNIRVAFFYPFLMHVDGLVVSLDDYAKGQLVDILVIR